MSTPPPATSPPPTPSEKWSGLDDLWNALRRAPIRRSGRDRWLGGVCAGVAERLGIDPVLVRIATVALGLLGGVGVIAYAVAWLLVPGGDDRIEAQQVVSGDVSASAVGGLTLLVAGFLVPDPWAWWRGDRLLDGGDVLWVLLLAGVVVAGVVWLSGRPGDPTRTPEAPEGDATSPAVRTSSRPARRGPGATLTTAVGGLALVAAGGTWLAAVELALPGKPQVLAACAALAVLSVTLVGLGLAGRRDGAVGGLGVLVAVLAVAAAVVPSWRTTQLAGSASWEPPTAAVAEVGWTLGTGDATLDLTDLDAAAAARGSSGTPVEVPVRVGVGGLTVEVPEGSDVEVRALAVVGSVEDATGSGRDAEPAQRRTIGAEATVRTGSGEPDVVVDARVLVGQVTVVEVER